MLSVILVDHKNIEVFSLIELNSKMFSFLKKLFISELPVCFSISVIITAGVCFLHKKVFDETISKNIHISSYKM